MGETVNKRVLTKYRLANDGFLVSSNLRIPLNVFLYAINSEMTKSYLLVYQGDNGDYPHITAFANGKKAFYILLSKDQYEEIQQPNINNIYLEKLMARTIDSSQLKLLQRLDIGYRFGNVLPSQLGELRLLKQYIDYCICSTDRIIAKELTVLLLSLSAIIASYLIGDVVPTESLPAFEAELIHIGLLLLRTAGFYYPVGKPVAKMLDNNPIIDNENDDYFVPSDWIAYNNEFFAIQKRYIALLQKSNHINTIKRDFYVEVKRAVLAVNQATEIDKNSRKLYYDEIRKVIKRFNIGLKRRAKMSIKDFYEPGLDAILTSNLEQLYQSVPPIETELDIGYVKQPSRLDLVLKLFKE